MIYNVYCLSSEIGATLARDLVFFLVQLSSVIPDINHPQVVSIFLGGILTIPKWYVLYCWVSHMSPLVFDADIRRPLVTWLDRS